MRTIKLGTRGSKLALTQSRLVASKLTEADRGLEVELEIVKTKGDIIRDVPLSQVSGQGFFVKEIEAALSRGEIDLAVHSAKDLPTRLAEGLTLAALLPREDPRDCLVSRGGETLEALAEGATIATSALRRQAMIAHLRPDLKRVELRGNVDTRLRKLDEGQFDAMIIARAALARLGLLERASEVLPLETFLPAVAQGALAVETRAADDLTALIAEALDDGATSAAVRAERALLAATQGGCQIPLGAYGRVLDGGSRLELKGCLISPDGAKRVEATKVGGVDAPEPLGEALGRELLDLGGAEILERIRRGGEG